MIVVGDLNGKQFEVHNIAKSQCSKHYVTNRTINVHMKYSRLGHLFEVYITIQIRTFPVHKWEIEQDHKAILSVQKETLRGNLNKAIWIKLFELRNLLRCYHSVSQMLGAFYPQRSEIGDMH